jgi:MerR family mercuric resistance operon transcriptional regulator
MHIGELAGKARVNIQTIRFYERRHLLREPARTPSGYRNYDRIDLESVVFIKWCQQLGFTLKEIKQLLKLHTAVADFSSVHTVRKAAELQSIIHMAEEKLANVQEKIKLLKTMGKQLTSTIEKLQSQPVPVCPASKPPVSFVKRGRIRTPRLRKAT